MTRKLRLLILVSAVVGLTAVNARSQYYSYETPDLRLVYYGKVQAYLVPHVARCVENSLRFHEHLFGWKPSERITVVMHDGSDYNNAGASTAPINGISLAIAPPSYAFETTPANERMNATFNHEMVHIVANDKAAGEDNVFRTLLFGKVRESSDHPETILYSYLTGPRRSAPRWYQEGIAVFMETWMAGGLGRALSSYDEMVFRTVARDSARLYDPVGLESEGTAADFQVGTNSYLYGTRFMSYLALQYGPEKLIAWVSRTSGSRAYYAAQFKKVYGVSLDNEWQRWIAWERTFQQGNLDLIRQYPLTPTRLISNEAPGSVARGAYDSALGKIYTAVNYPGQVAALVAIDMNTGEIERLQEIKGPALYFVTSMAYDSSSHTLFYTTDNNQWRDLRAYDLTTGKSHTLMKDARVGDLAFDNADSTLWGVRHFNGITTLVRMPPPYTEWNQIWSLPYGRNIYGLGISADGRHLTAGVSDISGRQRLMMFDTYSLLHGDTTMHELFDFQNSIPANFTWTPDGRYLIGTSYYSGVSNVFRYNLETDEMEGGSNCETGFFNPIVVSDDSLIVFEYTARGFVPVMIPNREVTDVAAINFLGQQIVEQHPVVTTWLADPPGRIPIDSLKTYDGSYTGYKHIGPTDVYPVVEGYGDYVSWGLHMDLQDPINQHRIDLTASYTPQGLVPDDERAHVELNYHRFHWKASVKYNDADFYDLFGPTKSSRRGYSGGLTYERTLLSDGPRSAQYSINATYYGNLRRLPEYQNITTSYDHFLGFGGSIGYANRRASLGAVDYEKGFAWRFSTANRYVNRKLFTRVYSTFDIGVPLPLGHSSVWLRNAGGYSPNKRIEPLANFFFGGFGNNWVDHGTIQRYRTYYSFPGTELNAIAGVNFVRSMVDWNLPPLRFRRLGIPMLYVSWARAALFSSGIATNIDSDAERREVGNIGAQVDFRLTLLSHLRMTFSVGYASAFEKHEARTDEFMASLQVL